MSFSHTHYHTTAFIKLPSLVLGRKRKTAFPALKKLIAYYFTQLYMKSPKLKSPRCYLVLPLCLQFNQSMSTGEAPVIIVQLIKLQ